MGTINRGDMLELTEENDVKKKRFDRIAGALSG